MHKQVTKSSPIQCAEQASLLRMAQVFREDLVAVGNYSSGSTTRRKFALRRQPWRSTTPILTPLTCIDVSNTHAGLRVFGLRNQWQSGVSGHRSEDITPRLKGKLMRNIDLFQSLSTLQGCPVSKLLNTASVTRTALNPSSTEQFGSTSHRAAAMKCFS